MTGINENLDEIKSNEEILVEKRCGIIMPIASMEGYTADHWKEVKNIIIESTKQVSGFNFRTEIVSDSDGEIDVIHKRIVQNIYNSDIVVCDISGKNPNVLFELGMRLTFDKPTIIIKDDKTDYMFDTGVIEHLTYPRDLRFQKIVDFKKVLADRIKKTYEKSLGNPSYSTFLGSFGEFTVPDLKQTSVSDVEQLILSELKSLRTEITVIRKESSSFTNTNDIRNTEVWDLETTVNEYIEANTEDTSYSHGNPINIFNDPRFRNHLAENGIDYGDFSIKTILNVIKKVQQEVLPF